MSVTEQIIQDNPDKYESLLEARILGKQLQMKLNQYKALQNQYDLLLQTKNNNRKRPTGGWKQITGKLKQISAVGKDWLWGVNNSNQIFTCKKPCNDSSWINIPGRLSQLEGGESEVWGVNAADNIFKMNVDHSSGWKQVTGKLTNISQGGGWVWGVNSSNNVYNIYRCKDPCDGNWILDSSSDTTPPGVKNLLKPNEYLTSNKYLVSNNKAFFLIMQSDGNLVVYKGSGPSDNKGALWSSGTSGKGESFAIMQSDGNFVVYKGSGPSDNKGFTWNSKTFGKGESFAIMQDDGNFVVYKGSGPSDNKGALWNSKTGGNTPPPTSVTPSLVQLSCSNTHVYGLDTSKNAWRKNIDGSGKWTRFGNPSDWQFYWINASNPDTVLAVGMNRHIYATNIDGTRDWYKADDQYNNIDNVSGDPKNANYYVTNTSNDIYRHEPVEQDGSWKDLNNENYQMGMVSSPTQTSDDWKFLGKSDTLNDCKLKAVQDDTATFSSVVYYPSDFGNDWSKSCFGGIKGKNINSGYQSKTITSLAPNGTTALGGDEGEKIAKEMKKLQVQIKKLITKIQKSGKGLDKTKNILNGETVSKSEELEKLLVKIETDRFEIDTLLRQPNEAAGEEDSNIRQISSYTTFSLWLLLGLVSIYMSYYVYSRESYEISMAVYVFIAIWILIIGKYYYKTVVDYGESSWKFISRLLPPIHVF